MSPGRTGFTTGTCAAAAAKAATMILCGMAPFVQVEIGLPDGARVVLQLERAEGDTNAACAAVRKDAGDDPDVTDGCLVIASVKWRNDGTLALAAGDGVGMVTLPGLSVPPGQPAINPAPRQMISEAIREITDRGVQVTISIPGGAQLAEKTFNPRLGITGGLSILGTSGIVRPFSTAALRDALKCALDVAVACDVKYPVFVPGRIGEKAARRHFRLAPEQLIEVSNEWGFVLDEAAKCDFSRLLVMGHPGKLAKLALGQWDTHSARSKSAVSFVESLARDLVEESVAESITVEGTFDSLGEADVSKVAEALAHLIEQAIRNRLAACFPVSVLLVNMQGEILGHSGEIRWWERAKALC
jgi:cobalt-precorrin-5B (C1)-methyltransferase